MKKTEVVAVILCLLCVLCFILVLYYIYLYLYMLRSVTLFYPLFNRRIPREVTRLKVLSRTFNVLVSFVFYCWYFISCILIHFGSKTFNLDTYVCLLRFKYFKKPSHPHLSLILYICLIGNRLSFFTVHFEQLTAVILVHTPGFLLGTRTAFSLSSQILASADGPNYPSGNSPADLVG